MKGEFLRQFFQFISSRFGNIYPNEVVFLYLTHNKGHTPDTNLKLKMVFLYDVDDDINTKTNYTLVCVFSCQQLRQ